MAIPAGLPEPAPVEAAPEPAPVAPEPDTAAKAPIEGKVYAAVIGGGAGYALSEFVLWLLGVVVFHAPDAADASTTAIASVPQPVAALVTATLALGATFGAAYRAKHTPRANDVTAP